MNTNFDAILTALRNNNGMAISSGSKTEVKIEAIATIGDKDVSKDVVALPADQTHYSINGMYVNDNGRAVISGYSWGVMGPEIIQDTAIASAEEWNKPKHHTPGCSYLKLNNVTNVTPEQGEVEMTLLETDHLIYQLGLAIVQNNPLPQINASANVLYGSNDNHLFLAYTKLPIENFGEKIRDNMLLGVRATKACSDLQIEASATETYGIETRDWYQAAMRNCPNMSVPLFAVFRDVFDCQPQINALSFSFVTSDGYYVTMTEIESRDAVSEKQAHSLLSGDIIQSRLDMFAFGEAMAELVMEKANPA